MKNHHNGGHKKVLKENFRPALPTHLPGESLDHGQVGEVDRPAEDTDVEVPLRQPIEVPAREGRKQPAEDPVQHQRQRFFRFRGGG